MPRNFWTDFKIKLLLYPPNSKLRIYIRIYKKHFWPTTSYTVLLKSFIQKKTNIERENRKHIFNYGQKSNSVSTVLTVHENLRWNVASSIVGISIFIECLSKGLSGSGASDRYWVTDINRTELKGRTPTLSFVVVNRFRDELEAVKTSAMSVSNFVTKNFLTRHFLRYEYRW